MSSKAAPAEAKSGRLSQIVQSFKFTREADPAITWILLALVIGIPVVFTLIVWLVTGRQWGWQMIPWIVVGVLLGLIAATFVFGRRAEKAAYASIEGQVGAAAAALNSLRSGWFVTPAVAISKNQDIIHRVVGRPGIILVSEGPASRVPGMLAAERRRTARWAPDIPIHEIESGNEEGQIPLAKLNAAIVKLPRAITAQEVTSLRKKLDAASTPPLPIPKGPMPKGGKVPRR